MNAPNHFATIAIDHGIVAEMFRVSPMFMRYGSPQRGSFGEAREARARRTQARNVARHRPRIFVAESLPAAEVSGAAAPGARERGPAADLKSGMWMRGRTSPQSRFRA